MIQFDTLVITVGNTKIVYPDTKMLTPQGKSINAIRTFVGKGTLVWGARTLDGNSLDWRYFSVRIGHGETMTGEDILEGILRITILVAVTRPAEFIKLTFQQQMQKS